MKFIHSPEDRGYPTEYLVARIKGRGAYLLKEWDKLIFNTAPFEYLLTTRYRKELTEHSSEGVRKQLSAEYAWVYAQMNKRLREVFLPFFLYFEIKTIIECFRYKREERALKEVEKLLSYSLLSKKVKNLLMGKSELPSVLEDIEKEFLPYTDRFQWLKQTFLQEGLSGLEHKLTRCLLEQIIRFKLHPLIKMFFTYIIDTKNIIILYKHLKWSVKAEPVFVYGGSIREQIFRSIISTRKISEIIYLIHRLTGLNIRTLTPAGVETALQKGLTRLIKGIVREGSDIGLILGYLWRFYIEAQNLSIILYGRWLERDAVKQELLI